MKTERTSRQVASKIRTAIWSDIPHDRRNRFYSERSLCRGYDFYNDLLGKFSWNEMLFLLLKGNLPSKKESIILNITMSSIINPGPRDWATQAAMTAAVSKATVGNCLLTGLAVLQGRYHGALCVEKSMGMFQEGIAIAENNNNISRTINLLLKRYPDLPGYGLYYSKRDKRAARLVELIKKENFCGRNLSLALEMEKMVSKNKGIWLTIAGAIGAILSDLGFTPKEGHGIFLISAAPGILAHLIEQMKGDWTTYPFYEPPEYDEQKKRQIKNTQVVYREDSNV